MSDSSPGGFAGILAGFGPVQKVFLFLGFAVFCMGVPGGFKLHNRTMMVGIALMAVGIAGHYWSTCRYDEIFVDGERSGGGLKVGTAVLGLVFSAVATCTAVMAYFSN